MSFLTDNYGRNRRRGQFGPNEVRDLNCGVFRLGPEVNEWSPFIEVMTTEELEKSLVEKERESRFVFCSLQMDIIPSLNRLRPITQAYATRIWTCQHPQQTET